MVKMNPRIYNQILKNLKEGSVATMTDYSQYEETKSNDGGAYSFTQRYTKLENGMWKISFHTSSNFDYCECCGSFHSSECSCDGEHSIYTAQEVAKFLESDWETPDYEIIIK
jgi:hypothetical protein